MCTLKRCYIWLATSLGVLIFERVTFGFDNSGIRLENADSDLAMVASGPSQAYSATGAAVASCYSVATFTISLRLNRIYFHVAVLTSPFPFPQVIPRET